MLFLLTIVINGLARILMIATTRQRNGASGMNRLTYRKAVNNVMLALTGVCTVLTVSILFVVLGYLVNNGATSIDWNFLTKLPKPTGESAAEWRMRSWAAR